MAGISDNIISLAESRTQFSVNDLLLSVAHTGTLCVPNDFLQRVERTRGQILCVLERVKSGGANEGMFQMSDFSFYFGTPLCGLHRGWNRCI